MIAIYDVLKKGNEYEHEYHLKILKKYCEEKGQDYQIYIDEVQSHVDLNRPKLDKMKEDIENGEISQVIVMDSNRFSKDVTYYENIMKFFHENNCKVVSLKDSNLSYISTIYVKQNTTSSIFENSGMGQCVILKENETPYSLIYCIDSKQFVVASHLDLKTGSWLHGSYFGKNLENALSYFNERSKENNDINLER